MMARHVEADEVGQSQRAHGMIGSELHGGVDVFSGGHAFLQHEDRFVDRGDEGCVDHESGYSFTVTAVLPSLSESALAAS